MNLVKNVTRSHGLGTFVILCAMQDHSKLTAIDSELIKIASKHAKERFENDFISIAGALRTKSGKVYTGINLKYRVRNTSACAETMAIYAALNDGEKEFDTIVGVKYFKDSGSFQVVNGCGWCRQLFLYNLPLNVITDNNSVLESLSADKLLPYAFL
jgi:cytidine deaminase